jgi:hypothetical protein
MYEYVFNKVVCVPHFHFINLRFNRTPELWRPTNAKPMYILFDVCMSQGFIDILAFLSEYKAPTDYHLLMDHLIVTSFKTIAGMNQRLLCNGLQSSFICNAFCPTFTLICEVMWLHLHCLEQMTLLWWFNFDFGFPELKKMYTNHYTMWFVLLQLYRVFFNELDAFTALRFTTTGALPAAMT